MPTFTNQTKSSKRKIRACVCTEYKRGANILQFKQWEFMVHKLLSCAYAIGSMTDEKIVAPFRIPLLCFCF